MTSRNQTELTPGRITRMVTLLCFVLAGALLIMSLIQSTSAGAGQSRYGIQLPESRVLSVNKRPRQSRSASLGALFSGSATR